MFSRAAAATRAIALRHPLFLQPVAVFSPPPPRAFTSPLDTDGNPIVNPAAGLGPTIDTRAWDGGVSVKRARLLYRARQTGWLETDLLCGAFAEANVKNLTDSELDMFAHLMKCETPDIFDYVAEKRAPPPPLQDSAFMKKIVQWSKDRAQAIRIHRVPNPQ